MPVTRRQAALKEGKIKEESAGTKVGRKRSPAESVPKKKARAATKKQASSKLKSKDVKEENEDNKEVKFAKKPDSASPWMPGTIERGHIYFLYRPRVQVEEVHSLDDVRNFQMILVPRPPEFTTSMKNRNGIEDSEMATLSSGDDAVPAEATMDEVKKRYRLILVGKKKLPDPSGGGRGKGRKETFWATVTKVEDDLDALEKGLGEKTYETKTRGTRHEEPVRLAARGAYAIVNNNPRVPSQRETHFGYYISHPNEPGEVQKTLGIDTASSFVMQVKNPLAPATGLGQASGKGANYPKHIMTSVFGQGGKKGRESYGLRFTSCETTELLDYEGAQLLLIAARGDEEGLETSLGEGRGEKLSQKEREESHEPVEHVFRELHLDAQKFPAAAIKGEWI